MRQMAQKQSYAYQSISAVMTLRIYHSAIALAADDRTGSLHLGHDIHLAYGRSRVRASVLFRHIFQSSCGTEVRTGIAGSVPQHIVGHRHKSIFFAEHLAILANHRQPVHIRVNHESYIQTAFAHKRHDVGKILFQRLRIVAEIARRLAIEFLHMLHAESGQKFRQDNPAHRIHTVYRHSESGLAYGLRIHELQAQYGIYMLFII